MTAPPPTRVLTALREICREFGFCDVLVDEQVEQIDPATQGASEITDLILRAEGVERPEYYDKEMRLKVEQVLDDWLFDPHGRGATSEQPLTDP